MGALDSVILLLLLALAAVFVWGIFQREVALKRPCTYHTWVWEEKTRSHRCSVCKHLANGGDDLKSWFSNGSF